MDRKADADAATRGDARDRPAGPVTDRDTDWLVDAYNVLHVTLLGGEEREAWWRADARQRLIERAEQMPVGRGRVWLVFDGPDPAPEPEPETPGPHLVFAPSADEWIVRRLRRTNAATCVVVTADRRLAGRCRHLGARIGAPGDFVAACHDIAAPGGAGGPGHLPDDGP